MRRWRSGERSVNVACLALSEACIGGHLRAVERLSVLVTELGGDLNAEPLELEDKDADAAGDDDEAEAEPRRAHNALTNALIWYCAGSRFWAEVSTTNPELDADGRANLELDAEGRERLAVLRLLLSRRGDIDPSALSTQLRQRTGDLHFVDFDDPARAADNVWKCTRLLHALQLLVAAGGSARALAAKLPTIPPHVMVLTALATEYSINVQDSVIGDMDSMHVRRYWPAEHVTELQCTQQAQRTRWELLDLVEHGSLAELRQAVAEGASLEAGGTDRLGRPALHIAASASYRLEVVEWLVAEVGVDVEDKDAEGRTAEEVARLAGSTGVCAHLRGRRAQLCVAAFTQVRWGVGGQRGQLRGG
eukprot:1693388-Rhodomonas_salina.1